MAGRDLREAHQREHALEHLAEDNKIIGHWTLDDERWMGHERLHVAIDSAHKDVHHLVDKALDEAAHANEKRFESVNAFREQLREQARDLASQESVTLLRETTAASIDQLRERIVAIEKGDVKQEGRQIGQGALAAIIVSSIVVAGILIGIISNLDRLAQ